MDRPYPRMCGVCGKRAIEPACIDSYNAKIKYNGELHQFTVENLPIDQCKHCGEQWFTQTTDDAIQAKFDNEKIKHNTSTS